MKKLAIMLLMSVATVLLTLNAAMAFNLPANTNIQFHYNNWDSLSPFPLADTQIGVIDPFNGQEFSWGILNVSSITNRNLTKVYWTMGSNGEYLTGMWHDLKLGLATLDGSKLNLYLYGGQMDIYLDNSSLSGYTEANPALGKEGRIGNTDTYTNFTDSNVSANPFLTLDFVPGILNVDPLAAYGLQTTFFITLDANSVENTAGGDSYASITGGDYASLFNSNSFVNGAADFKLGFHGQGPSEAEYNNGVTPFDADTFDPADGRTTPEPASMLLLGMGLLGLVPVVRRKKVA